MRQRWDKEQEEEYQKTIISYQKPIKPFGILAFRWIFRKTARRFPVFILEAFDEISGAAKARLESNFSHGTALLP